METPFILLAPVGWFLLRRREGSHDDARVRPDGRLSSLFAVFAVVLYGCYAAYVPFDNWTFLRFLLPAIALLLLLCALAVSELGARLHSFPREVPARRVFRRVSGLAVGCHGFQAACAARSAIGCHWRVRAGSSAAKRNCVLDISLGEYPVLLWPADSPLGLAPCRLA